MSGENLLAPRRRRTSLLSPWEEEESRQREFGELDRAAGIEPNTTSTDEEDHDDGE